MIRRDRNDREAGVPLPWIAAKGGLDYLRATVMAIARAATVRDDLSLSLVSPRWIYRGSAR